MTSTADVVAPVQRLRALATPLPADRARAVVPEHAVKELLRERGLHVPGGITVPAGADVAAAVAGRSGPLVLKAHGPGIVHKTDVGAVRLGLSAEEVPAAVDAMTATLAGHGLVADGFLVEEQHPGGVELLVGVLRHPAVGPVALLGVGGTLTEVVDRSVVRLAPLTPDDATEMVAAFPVPALLDGVRGGAPVDRTAIADLLLALAGEDGLAVGLGDDLAELECNPVVAGPDWVAVLDARLILAPPAVPAPLPAAPATDFTRLFAPRTVAVAGASTSKSTFGNRFLAAYRAVGWTDGLYALHPSAAEIDGVPAVRTPADVPGGLDYLLVAVPAAACADLVRSAAGHARFVHVVSGGFGETGTDGADRQQELARLARESGLRLLGPNCMGVYSPAGRQTFQLGAPMQPGRVSVLSQSGGLAGDVLQAGRRHGLALGKLVSLGNAVDVTAGELLDWLVDDPDTDVIGLYLEGLGGGQALVRALRRAAGRTPVVVLAGGLSRQGARAVASHTGSMTGDERVWQAIAAATGVTVVSTLEDLVAVLGHLQRCAAEPVAGIRTADDDTVLVVGPGGGASVLATDACDRAGLTLAPVVEQVRAALRAQGYGAGTSIANPVEIPVGPAVSPDAFTAVLEPLLAAQPFPDLLLHVNVAAYYGYGPGDLSQLVAMLHRVAETARPDTRIAMVLRNAEVATGADAAVLADGCRSSGLSVFSTFDAAARAIAAVKGFHHRRG